MFLGLWSGFGMFIASLSAPFAWGSYALLQYELFIVDIFRQTAVFGSKYRRVFRSILILSYGAIFVVVLHLRRKENWQSENLDFFHK